MRYREINTGNRPTKGKPVYKLDVWPRKTIPAGTKLFHGTDAPGKDFRIPRGPAFFAWDQTIAHKWAGWTTHAHTPADRYSDKRVIEYVTTRDIELLDLDAVPNDRRGDGWARWCEMITGELDELGPQIVAAKLKRLGENGWTADSEVMLCNPSRDLKFVERQLVEAPVADFQFIDKSDEIDTITHKPGGKMGSSFRDDDLRAINSPKWRAKLIQTFRKTPEPINIYLYNSKFLMVHHGDNFDSPRTLVTPTDYSDIKHMMGSYFPEDFEKTFGFLPPNYKNCFNVLFTHNEGDERIPLTPWMVGHRLVHALVSEMTVRPDEHTQEFDQAWRAMTSIAGCLRHARAKTEYPLNSWARLTDEEEHDCWAESSTLLSAKHHRIKRSGEFLIELITQYFITGDFTINTDWASPACADQIDMLRDHERRAKAHIDEGIKLAKGKLIVL